MATARTNPSLEGKLPSAGVAVPLCAPGQTASSSDADDPADTQQEPSQPNPLQALLAFWTLREQVRRRRTPETYRTGNDGAVLGAEPEEGEQFTVDEVLQLVADRAVAITGADGLAIALAENNEIVLRAAAGTVRPDFGARIDRDSPFSEACVRTAQIVICDDTETDARVNLQVCRHLGARSMVAVPLCARGRGVGLLQAFSARPFEFNDSDVGHLRLLAEFMLAALTPEDKDGSVESAQILPTKVEVAASEPETLPFSEPKMLTEEPGSMIRQSGTLALVVSIVLAAAFAGRVWWKPRTSRLANQIARTEQMAPKPTGIVAKAPADASSAGRAANPVNLNPGTTSNGSPATNSPARPRKLSRLLVVTGIQHWSSADASTVVLNLEDQVQYEAHRLVYRDRIYFDLHDTQLASNLAWKSIKVGDAFLKRIRIGEPVSGVTRLVLETKANTDFSVSLEPKPYRLVVKVRKVAVSSPGAANRFPNATDAEKQTNPAALHG